MNRRKEKLLLFGCICFLSGILIQCRMEMYMGTYASKRYISYANKYIPFGAVYLPSEPQWAKVCYKPARASMIWELFQEHGDSFKELLKYVKEKKEYGPYNICYRYQLDEDAASWKTEKRFYEYMDEYDEKFGYRKHIEDILFYQNENGTVLKEGYIDSIMQKNGWDLYDIGRVQWSFVHYITPEVLAVGERPVDEFAVFLLNQHFLSDPEMELEIIVRNIETEEDPLLILALGRKSRERFHLDGYLFYHPNLPKDVKIYYNSNANKRWELILIELEPGWYFFSRYSEEQGYGDCY